MIGVALASSPVASATMSYSLRSVGVVAKTFWPAASTMVTTPVRLNGWLLTYWRSWSRLMRADSQVRPPPKPVCSGRTTVASQSSVWPTWRTSCT